MNYRVIIRFSLDDDDGAVTTDMRNRLEALGFSKIGTSSYENQHVSGPDLGHVMTTIGLIAQPSPAALDHLWVYVDRPD